MTDNNHDTKTDEVDLRAIYSAGSPQRVPAHLDKIVMRGARNELQENATFRGFLRWRQPLGFAITVAFACALLFQWSEFALIEQGGEAAPVPESGFATEAANSPARIREIGQTATHRFLGEDQVVDAGTESLQGDVPVCRDDQIKTPESWLDCIAILRESGFAQQATMESKKFQLAHPDIRITP